LQEGQAPVRAEGLQAARQVDASKTQEGRQRVAPDQGERRVRRSREAVLGRVGALGDDGRGAPRREGPRCAPEETAGQARRVATSGPSRRYGADARRNARGAVLEGGLALRVEARRLPVARRPRERRRETR